VLPTRLPNLLVNGSAASRGHGHQHPAAQPQRVVDACLHLLKNPQATLEELMEIIPAPDFPTRASSMLNGVREGYAPGAAAS